MQKLEIYQSLWAMELRRPDGFEWKLEQKFEMCKAAGYDGLAIDLVDSPVESIQALKPLYAKHGLGCIVTSFPKTVEDLRPVLRAARDVGARFVNVIGLVMPLRVEDAAPVIRAWIKMSEEARMPVLFETHRNCITNDLFFTLLLMEQVPDMRLCGDLSHYLVDREFRYPINEQDHGYVRRILERCDAFQGRVASREQIQVQISFRQHRKWLELFLGWWEDGFRLWRARAPEDAVLNFQCELGPPHDYAITGPDDYEMSDRWQEALIIRERVQEVWRRLQQDGGGDQ
ncbi:MAG: sugar phosphate isomerase/epimerase family protein [Dongiaceae bacterium]